MIRQPLVLVVEHDQLIRESIALRLSRAGYLVSELSHPRQALAAATERRYDVAVLASELPEMDAISLMEQLQRRGGIQQFVVVTPDDSAPGATAAIDQGAFAVVAWARVPRELAAVVERAIEASYAA